jgi:hypothetical protein
MYFVGPRPTNRILDPLKTGDRNQIPSVSEAVREAAAICDPNGDDAATRGLIDAFEDDDRPVTAVDDFEETLASVERGIDPDQDTPAAQMTVAAAIWLSTNPDQEHHHREHVLREAARLYFHGEPPPDVAAWLRDAGVA